MKKKEMKPVSIKITQNFENNLENIEQFLSDSEAPQAFDVLLNEIAEKVIPNLERFPDMGRRFMQRPAQSVEVSSALAELQKKLQGGELHEYLISDYLLLYVRYEETIHLLSIKHHKQLSFDFSSRW